MLAVLEGRELDPGATQAGVLLATVLGQHLDIGEDGSRSPAGSPKTG